jgi:DNA processing protein
VTFAFNGGAAPTFAGAASSAVESFRPGEPRFPARLTATGWCRELDVRGTVASGPAVAIVGARAASGAAMERAYAIARHCAMRGVHVVSGGALGIDGAAHRGALAGGGTTTVVLGNGIDIAYPVRHAALFEQVVASGGALVSMFPCGTEPRRETFPQRNRLIAALADVVIVIEADVRSGSLSTARAARELGRLLAACPGSPGCERLLDRGAMLVEHGEDALDALAGRGRTRMPPSVDPIAAVVASAIASGAHGIDAIVGQTGLSVRDVLRALPTIDAAKARMQ